MITEVDLLPPHTLVQMVSSTHLDLHLHEHIYTVSHIHTYIQNFIHVALNDID